MKMRSRLLPTLNNREVEDYLDRNDIIIVPVGTVEMHGGLPLGCETVVSEGIAVKMAEQVDGLVLPHLPYFYAGATAIGRGTTQVPSPVAFFVRASNVKSTSACTGPHI